ncbi:SH2 domain-containing adapter protein B-like [Hydractinia symbiolongicarpus]|uniref:SH2 domain-containing adapter protein B-like n=1 Tax=Hydractinia symbiolongicarpus TaxID=13093 RepID=UPI0025511B04|nr:SH2 domain-containing adapter protein B-like [Hydractinia symbiolongicarpus]
MAANFGKFFKKKLTKLKTQDSKEDSDDDDGYQDPSVSCPTEPPGVARGIMPVYPPPRPNSPKNGVQHAPNNMVKRDDYQDPWDSKKIQKNDTSQNNVQTEYEDPFDARFTGQQKKQESIEDEEYSEPYEPVNRNVNNKKPTDTYDDPWDVRRNSGLGIETKPQTIIAKKPGPRDDYSDPWDSKVSNSLKSTEEYDDTYSDPYDTDKKTVLDATKLKKDESYEDDDDLYDMPENEMAMIGVPAGKNTTASEKFRPQGPAIPNQKPLQGKPAGQPVASQGDYDAPWEWKVKDVQAEFEKRFSVSEKKSPVIASRQKPNMPNGNFPRANSHSRPVQNNFKEKRIDVCEIDPTIPLDNQGWFHGRVRRGDAEALLKGKPDSSYLIRNSESSKVDYSLSLRNNGETMHLKISCRDGRYILGVNSRPYDTIPEMIHHYSRNKLNILGDVHVKLQYPVLQEPMYFTVEPGT